MVKKVDSFSNKVMFHISVPKLIIQKGTHNEVATISIAHILTLPVSMPLSLNIMWHRETTQVFSITKKVEAVEAHYLTFTYIVIVYQKQAEVSITH